MNIFRRFSGLVCLTTLSGMGLLTHGAEAGKLRFFDSANGTGDNCGSISADKEIKVNFKNSGNGFTNDEARSVRCWFVVPGTTFFVFDNPSGKKNDDWAEITIKRWGDFVVNTFERDFENDDYRIDYHKDNGLNGKISRLEIGFVFLQPSETPRHVRLAMRLDEIYNGFPQKAGEAFEFISQDSQYRLYSPDITVDSSGGMLVTAKLDHIRNNAKDDHGAITLRYNAACELTEASSSIALAPKLFSGQGATFADTIDVANELADQSGNPKAQLAAAGAKLAGTLVDGLIDASESGGRLNFPNVIAAQIDKIGLAVIDTCETPPKPDGGPILLKKNVPGSAVPQIQDHKLR